ncbi:MAG TPA: MBL fold metallo-hydrolase [Ardenticatenaceae bacterium]|nr:MBL fold metallo-hydrolase [Ardenticatenaceae bacterium]
MNVHLSNTLIEQIERLLVPPGQLALWALGQAGFVVKGGATIAYIDPYLSDAIAEGGGPARRFPVPLDPAGVTHARVVFATHEHADHVDPATLVPLMAASPQARLVTSTQGRDLAVDAGIAAERLHTPRLGERVELAGLAYIPIPAAHYEYEVDAEGHSRWMGFLIECNGVNLYHAGDTIVIPELIEALRDTRIDVALLPTNGRDFFREQQQLIGNLWPRESVQLATQLGAGVLIPMHNDLFEENRLNPALFFDALERHAPWQRCHLLQPGELYLYAG